MEWHQVLIKPLITEKATASMERKDAKLICYPFEVSLGATKPDIKAAIERMAQELYGKTITVKRVNTLSVKGKIRRKGGKTGKTGARKKALIYLPVDEAIDIF